MKWILPYLSVILFGLIACSSFPSTRSPVYPLPPDAVSVQGDRIMHNSKPFAELRYFRNNKVIGLGIYYFSYDKEVWIFPKEGWSLLYNDKEFFEIVEIDRIWNDFVNENKKWMQGTGPMPRDTPTRRIGGKFATQKLIKSKKISSVKISKNGRYIYYKTPGKSYDTLYHYEVESGTTRRVSREKN